MVKWPGANEYRIVINEAGEVDIQHMDGSQVKYPEMGMLFIQIQNRYERKLAIYSAEGMTTERVGQHKIGVSNDPERRAKELDAFADHWIICSAARAWKLEREVHRFFQYWRVDGEWFRFDDEVGQEYHKRFLALKSQLELVLFLREGLPIQYHALKWSWGAKQTDTD